LWVINSARFLNLLAGGAANSQWNVISHADLNGHGCPSPPAMQYSAGADLTAALYR